MTSAVVTRQDFEAFAVRRIGEYAADWLRPGAKLRICSLTERERAAVERRMLDEQRNGKDSEPVSYRALLIQLTIVDEEGLRMYGEADLPYIESLDARVTSRLIAAIDAHCQMGEQTEAERIEEAEKNF